MEVEELETQLKINEKTVVLCHTENLANQVLNIFHNIGLNWHDGISYLSDNKWSVYKNITCYNPFTGKTDSINFYITYGDYIIIPALTFIKLHKQELLVPEEIKIIQHKSDKTKDILGLIFYNDKQVINYRSEYQSYEVYPVIHSSLELVKCKFVKTPFIDLELGDIFIYNIEDKQNIEKYEILCDERRTCITKQNSDVINIFYTHSIKTVDVYKVVPINI